MYPWIWRHLPGPIGARLAQAAALLLGVVALLFLVVFPAAGPHLPVNQVTVHQPGGDGNSGLAPAGSPTP